MNHDDKNWKLISRKVVYDGHPYIKISMDKVQLPNGKIIDDYHRIEVHNAVMLLVENEKKELLVYKEYRHGVAEVSLTFPAGGIESNENIYDAAKRELLEETGFEGKNFNILNDYIVSGSYMFGELTFIKVTNIIKKIILLIKILRILSIFGCHAIKLKKRFKTKTLKLLPMQLPLCYGYLIMSNRLWITGSNGLVGSSLVRVIADNNHYEILKTSRKDFDQTQQSEVKKWVSDNRPDTIVITSALVGGIHYNNSHQSDFLYENAMINLNVIQAALENNVKKLYF